MNKKSTCKIVFLVLLTVNPLFADLQYNVNNTNYTIDQSGTTYNYDRLRLRNDYTNGSYYATFIGDAVNYYGGSYINSSDFSYVKAQKSDTAYETQSGFHDYGEGAAYAKVYRFYGGYQDEKNNLVAGLQNIPMGVGKFWNPTNIFNPQNIYALEPDEVFGVMALSYTRSLDTLSSINVVASQRKDHSFKYALRYKTFIKYADFALDAVKSDDTAMLGYELQGNLGSTGIELQSEGAYIESSLYTDANTTHKERFYQATLGCDYGFVNGVTLTTEALYSSKTFDYSQAVLNQASEVITNLTDSNFYMGASLSYDFNIFLSGSATYIGSLDGSNSRFFSPKVTYTLNDYNSFTLGAMLYESSATQRYPDTYYFNYTLSF